MCESLTLLRNKIVEHIEKIWVEEPKDILFIKNGHFRSGAGIKNQYFTTLVMLSGEVRALGIHIFPDLLHYAKSNAFSLEQLILMAKRALQIDLGVISYFGLEEYGELLQEYFETLGLIENTDDFIALTQDIFTLTNRYQLWLHQIFPWYLSVLFPKANIQDMKEFIEQI